MKKSRIIPVLAGLACLLASVGVAGYPMVRNLILEYQTREEISDYEEAVGMENKDTLSQVWLQAENYNDALQGSEAVSVAAYDDLLAVTDAIGYLEIPKLSVYLPIYHGLEEEVLQKGIGHIPETSLPVGGTSTHCVLSGHSGLPAARILTELDQMENGDEFYLHVLDQTLAYCVDQISVVLPDDTSKIQIEEGKDYVTLLTCTPYGVNSHRLLVRGVRTAYNAEEAVSVQAKSDASAVPWRLVTWGVALLITIIFLIAGIVLVLRGF